MDDGKGKLRADRALDRETRAAAAARCGIWIVDLERGSDQLGREVDFRAVHKFEAHFIDQDADPIARDHKVIRIGGIIEIEFV